MKTYIFDTNAFLRFLINDIPTQYAKVEQLLTRAKNKRIYIRVPHIVIFEIQFALEKFYHFSKEQNLESLTSLLGADYLDVDSKDVFLKAISEYKKSTLSFVDCFLLAQLEFEKSLASEVELFTFDKKLLKATST